MKLAILISGPPRFNKDFDSLIENVKEATSVDWFFYLCNNNPLPDKFNEGITERHFISKTWRFFTDIEWAKNKIKSNLPEHHRIADFKVYDHSLIDIPLSVPPSPPNNSMLNHRVWRTHHHWKQVDLMRQAEEERMGQQYDLVFRARPDTGLVNVLNLEQIKQSGFVEIPTDCWHGNPPISDILAIGGSDQMKIYCDLYNNSLRYYQQGTCAYHAESLLGRHLQENKVPYRTNNWTFVMWRESSIIKDADGTEHWDWGNWE